MKAVKLIRPENIPRPSGSARLMPSYDAQAKAKAKIKALTSLAETVIFELNGLHVTGFHFWI